MEEVFRQKQGITGTKLNIQEVSGYGLPKQTELIQIFVGLYLNCL